MDPQHKKILKAIVLEMRHTLEGWYDSERKWHPGDFEQRLAAIGVRRDREPVPVDELPHLSDYDKKARKVVDAYLNLRREAGVSYEEAVAEFVRETAYNWANRLLALRCMEARELIDEVILQKDIYGGRSLEHHRLAQRQPECCTGEDDGLFAVLGKVFAERAKFLPMLFAPNAPGIALKPAAAALKRCLGLLSGTQVVKGQDVATNEVFKAPNTLGWTYQYWNTEEKDRVFEKVRTQKGAKIEGADIIPATQLYTEPYMVKFLVQNSLGATWMAMHPESKLYEKWEYYVREADRAPVKKKPIREITFLDPACGSGHFLIEAFDLFYDMYLEEGELTEPEDICRTILGNNLFGIDIDERSIQIAEVVLWMKVAEKAFNFRGAPTNLVSTHIHLPKGKDHLREFLKTHPEDVPLRPALEVIFGGLEEVVEIGSLLRIEEPVEKELRHLKEVYDAEKDKPVQSPLWAEMVKPVQGKLPIGVEDFNAWKTRTLLRLKEHFAKEAEATDLTQAFFSQSVEKGLDFFELLSRKYDVVAANPPYMGSKNMGPILKKYVERHYAPGKRDLYAAFILRCLELTAEGGRVAMVTQQSWMFLRSFADLRAVEEENLKELGKHEFKGLLRDTTLETLAHLGPGAFGEIGGEVVNIALFSLAKATAAPEHRLTAFRVIGPKSPEEKDNFLQKMVKNDIYFITSKLNQSILLIIDEAPIVYWLTQNLYEILQKHSRSQSGDKTEVDTALSPHNTPRFVRYFWEVDPKSIGKDYWWFTSGGGFCRWAGYERQCVDWALGGARLRAFIADNYPPEKFTLLIKRPETFGKEGCYYAAVARGSLGVRLSKGAIFSDTAPGVSHTILDNYALAGILSSRVCSFLVRALSASTLSIRDPYVMRLPLHSRPLSDNDLEKIRVIVASAEKQKQWLMSFVPVELKFLKPTTHFDHIYFQQAILTTIEGALETIIFIGFGLSDDTKELIISETGTPAAWFPLIYGLDNLASLRENQFNIPVQVFDNLAKHARRHLSPLEMGALKERLKLFYEAGPGSKEEFDEAGNQPENGDEENEHQVSGGARIPIPTETFLEELSQKLEIHPISIYWLLKEGIEKEGWRCLPEERRITADRFTVIILRLLGHRWPKQIEAGEKVPEWADEDGIIPMTEGVGEPILLSRVRERIGAEFKEGDVNGIEREFAKVMEKPLEQWLETEFFKHHTKQFKKRPIAWQFQSGSYTKKKKPAYAAMLYYHKLDGDILPKICSQQIGPLRCRLETEMRMIEGVPVDARSDRQDRRRMELEDSVLELKDFEAALQKVSEGGFQTPGLRQFAIDDAILCLKATWLRRLSEVIKRGPLAEWRKLADETYLECPLADWIEEAMAYLDHFCSAIGPKAPEAEPLKTDPDSPFLASLIAPEAKSMVNRSLEPACDKWWKKFGEAMLSPLREKIRSLKEEIKRKKEEIKELKGAGTNLLFELDRQVSELEYDLKGMQGELAGRSEKGKDIRKIIEDWSCPEAETWEEWLATQPMYDAISSLEGKRTPPKTIEEFIRQEAFYAPDINDGVRVNIAPIQKAGLLAADVLAKKDSDKAIADRAEWRSDERRWCREGKLPKPGWWIEEKGTL